MTGDRTCCHSREGREIQGKAMIDRTSVARAANLDLISGFEQGRAPGAFHHADHVRVAFAYIAEFPLLEAIAKFSAALARFALSAGKPNLYHQTITWAYLLLIHERVVRCGRILTWDEFAARNPDLLIWRGGIVERFYSKAALDSDLARSTFIFPDQCLDFETPHT
jgi:hypothetical protein